MENKDFSLAFKTNNVMGLQLSFAGFCHMMWKCLKNSKKSPYIDMPLPIDCDMSTIKMKVVQSDDPMSDYDATTIKFYTNIENTDIHPNKKWLQICQFELKTIRPYGDITFAYFNADDIWAWFHKAHSQHIIDINQYYTATVIIGWFKQLLESFFSNEFVHECVKTY